MNIDAKKKNFNKTLAKKIKQWSSGFIPGMEGWLSVQKLKTVE